MKKSRVNNPDTPADVELRQCLDEGRSFVMVAGAGSGKTTSLVKALAHVGKSHGSRLRENGQRVACITYTEIATAQIFQDVGRDPLFHVSTIHSFLWSLVKPFQHDIGLWVASRIEEKLVELGAKAAAFTSRTRAATRQKNAAETERFQRLKSDISDVKYFSYGTGSDYSKGILGHDDILKMVPRLIVERPLLRRIVAQKYPIFFVDESQDTAPVVVDALKSVRDTVGNKFCLGFFGDPMQKIYSTGVGKISLVGDSVEIKKPENFRCSLSVLHVINNIRVGGDDLQQTPGKRGENIDPPQGAACIFVLPSDDRRKENLTKVRQFMARHVNDPLWNMEGDDNVKILVLVHRMAAARLGFETVYSALNDGAPEAFRTGFAEGTLWTTKPFLDAILPVAEAFAANDQSKVMQLLRIHCPRLSKTALEGTKSPTEMLRALKSDVEQLTELTKPDSEATIADVISFVRDRNVIELDPRFSAYDAGSTGTVPTAIEDDDDETDDRRNAVVAYLACPAKELWGYRTYVEEKSPYSTQHGIKGDEFARVLVVLDDEEASYHLYSYEKLLGLKPLSDTDRENVASGTETVVDRTRRLFYVCCSRALQDLAVILYTTNVAEAVTMLEQSNLFDPTCIKTIDDVHEVHSAQ
jgi:DNA helicase-2/ATP-dependent DNA helicase PcrA